MSYSFSRAINLFALIAAVFLLLMGFFLQYVAGVLPCTLCIVQRFIYVFLILLLLIAVLHRPKKTGVMIYGILTCLIAALGIWAAARQVWLEHQPTLPTTLCVPGFSYLIAHLPWQKMLELLFKGQESCGVVKWRLFGLSIATWSLMSFIGYGVLGVVQVFFSKRSI